MIFLCGTDARRRLVRGLTPPPPLNGIDFVEVATGSGPEVRRTLIVHFINPVVVPPPLNTWHVDGGERFRGIQVREAQPTSDPSVIRLITDVIGDLSWYTLRLAVDETVPFPVPPDGYDPALAQVQFTFRPGCGADIDCANTWQAGEAPVGPPDLDYTAKDYAALRRVLLDRFARTQPNWQGNEPTDVRTALVELLAYAGDRLSYLQDAVATEAYLGTARRRISVRRHARLIDYGMHDGCTARAWVQLAANADQPLPQTPEQLLRDTLAAEAAGTKPPAPTRQLYSIRLMSGPGGAGTTIAPGSPADASLRAAGSVVYEVVDGPDAVYVAHNNVRLHTWSGVVCTLPTGTRSATLAAALPQLAIGDVLVLAATTKGNTDVDPAQSLAHPVRLTAVKTTTDPLDGTAVTEVQWAAADALPFDLRLTQDPLSYDPPDPSAPADYAVALGNIVLVDQGEHARKLDGEVVVESVAAGMRPALGSGPVSQRPAIPATGSPARAAFGWDLADVRPTLELGPAGAPDWQLVASLLDVPATLNAAVLEVDDAGVGWLRYNGFTAEPAAAPSTEALPPALLASYAVGNGSAGNVGPSAINRFVLDDPVAGVGSTLKYIANPMAAAGGLDPETIENVRQHAPFAFRTQERCITPQDYAQRCQQLPEVQRAFAQLMWTGSWHTVFIYVDRVGGLPVGEDFSQRIRSGLEPFRMMEHDLEIKDPVYVPLDLTLSVCPSRDADWPTVRTALEQLFGARVLPDGTPGLFHPDRLSFGMPLYTGPLIAAAQAVPGVVWADITDLHTVGTGTPITVTDGRLVLDPPRIPRLDNNPDFPDRGTFRSVLAAAS